jgi:metal-sulfur cluster biosynthetic enzyme
MTPSSSNLRDPAGAANRATVWTALDAVIDPELDEPITTLRFVSACEVSPEGDVEVRLRLPTPQCAPNFAFLMASDALGAVLRLPGVRQVSVRLEDHYTGREINAALANGHGFTGAFPGETDDDSLRALRDLFARKALTARLGRVCLALLAGGATHEELATWHVRDLPDTAEVRRCRKLRDELGLDEDPDAPAFVTPDGEPVSAAGMGRWLRVARLISTSLEANGGLCRSLLAARHELEPEEVPDEGRAAARLP